MNLKVEEILILIVAFVIGYFVSNMISGSSLGSSSIVKAVGGKHDLPPWQHRRVPWKWMKDNAHNCKNIKVSGGWAYYCGKPSISSIPTTYSTSEECVENCDKDQFYSTLDPSRWGTYKKDKDNNWIFDHD